MTDVQIRFTIPDFVLDVCRALAGAGETGYVVGGSLRDLLRGEVPSDWDLATTAAPEDVTRLFRRTVPTGIAHGTVTVLVEDASVEVTTLRGEGAYSDGRRPDEVVFLDDIVEDLARRDFTINAMAFEPLSGAFFDPFDGRGDLGRRLVRAVGDPLSRFEEDGLRVLRAARFSAALEFDIERETRSAMAAKAAGLAHVSAERKRDELKKLLLSRVPSRGLAAMADARLLAHVCPELDALFARPDAGGAARKIALSRVDGVARDLVLRFAALLFDLPADFAQGCCAALKLDSITRKAVAAVCAAAPPDPDAPWSPADVRRALSRSGVRPLRDRLDIARADLAARSLSTEALDRLSSEVDAQLAARAPLSVGDLAVKGRDLIDALGMPPGPEIGRLLGALLERVLERPEENTREALIETARELRAAP